MSLKDSKQSYPKQILFEIKRELKHFHEKEVKAAKNVMSSPKAFYRFAKESPSVQDKATVPRKWLADCRPSEDKWSSECTIQMCFHNSNETCVNSYAL